MTAFKRLADLARKFPDRDIDDEPSTPIFGGRSSHSNLHSRGIKGGGMGGSQSGPRPESREIPPSRPPTVSVLRVDASCPPVAPIDATKTEAQTDWRSELIAHREGFADIRSELFDLIERKRSDATRTEYRNIVVRVLKDGTLPDLNRYRRGYRRKIRKAVLMHLAIELDGAFAVAENLASGSDHGAFATAMKQVVDLRTKIIAIRNFRPEPGRRGNRQVRGGVRNRVLVLPTGWEFRLEEVARTRAVWYYPICIMLAVGLRPADIARGVTIRTGAGGGLEFEIDPAKQGGGVESGTGKRWVEVALDAPWVEALDALRQQSVEGVLSIQIDNPKQATNVLVEISRRHFSGIGGDITPYVLRHRFACVLRQGGKSGEERAQYLGHRDNTMPGRYGLNAGNVSLRGAPISVRNTAEPAVRKPGPKP